MSTNIEIYTKKKECGFFIAPKLSKY